MEPEAYLDLLRCYYDCTAQAVIEEGGEILEFIGDAVLAIFPIKGETGRPEAVRAGTRAMERALDAREKKAPQIAAAGGDIEIRFSISMAVGEVMFGNIGVPERLTFSAIGPVVNAVARIDDLTKTVGRSVLATEDVAAIEPDRWTSVGRHPLSGFDHPIELFARVCKRDAFDAASDAAKLTA
jgi:adenylate cyclase